MHRPPLLAAGARVALVSPAGPLRGAADLDRAVQNARDFGWEPVVGEHALARQGYFAGPDDARLADLNRALAADDVDGVWCVRGGYGAMRLLEGIDYAALARHPKALVGYSDITALHAAVGVRCGLVTFHGPTARADLTPFSRDALWRAVGCAGADPCGRADGARTIRPGRARGRLAGGNLALVAALAGTAFAPVLDGAILVLEDVNEAVYRVDRMLRQLLLAGLLRGCRAIVFGHCTSCAEESDDGARSLDDVLAEAAELLDIPCLAGVPVGHIDDQWTLPLGADAEVDAEEGWVRVVS
ncbi:MAG TPA: LD-carboxypeptidase [Gemmatimonadaceae bacterium]|nr:LD-carboxypeptidase [Gemmatimonadaceae bacterium]